MHVYNEVSLSHGDGAVSLSTELRGVDKEIVSSRATHEERASGAGYQGSSGGGRWCFRSAQREGTRQLARRLRARPAVTSFLVQVRRFWSRPVNDYDALIEPLKRFRAGGLVWGSRKRRERKIRKFHRPARRREAHLCRSVRDHWRRLPRARSRK